MTERNFKVGDIVTIKGQGEMLLVEDCDKDVFPPPEERVWRCYGHGPPSSYWVRQGDIVRKATKELIILRHKEAAARNVSCNSPGCWCRKYVP